jgi:hypothetical protein
MVKSTHTRPVPVYPHHAQAHGKSQSWVMKASALKFELQGFSVSCAAQIYRIKGEQVRKNVDGESYLGRLPCHNCSGVPAARQIA